MLKHKRIPTSEGVWRTIFNAHSEEFTIFTDNDNDIEYGFKNTDYPLIGRNRYKDIIDYEYGEYIEYWLCVPIVEHVREKVRKPRRET